MLYMMQCSIPIHTRRARRYDSLTAAKMRSGPSFNELVQLVVVALVDTVKFTNKSQCHSLTSTVHKGFTRFVH